MVFDAVALVLSSQGCVDLLSDSAAIQFAMDAFGHLKAVGFSKEADPLLDKAGVVADSGVIKLDGKVDNFLKAARTRQWEREGKVRSLA